METKIEFIETDTLLFNNFVRILTEEFLKISR